MKIRRYLLVVSQIVTVLCGNALAADKSIELNTVISKGERVLIDFNEQCAKLISDCSTQSIDITLNPEEGILFDTATDGVMAYQHAGTSDIDDRFDVELRQSVKDDTEPYAVNVQVAVQIVENSAEVEILSPAEGERVDGSSVSVDYIIRGSGYDHLHLELIRQSIDHTPKAHSPNHAHSGHVSVHGDKGTHIFKNLDAGDYAVSATLARADHKQILNSQVIINFTVGK